MFGLPFVRARRFETNFLVLAPSAAREPVGAGGRMFGNRLRKQHAQLTEGDGQSIPALYSEHIGHYAMMELARAPEEEKEGKP